MNDHSSDPSSLALSKFRLAVMKRMRSHERPFVCSGSPLESSVFLVGFNPATRMNSPFWSYWSDGAGFNRRRFLSDYEQARPVQGVRRRLNAMVRQLDGINVLETNICSLPTKKASDLAKCDRRTDVFRYLLRAIKPEIVFLHSNEPIRYFRRLLQDQSIALPHHELVSARLNGRVVKVCASEGPLWRKKTTDMEELARRLAAEVSRGGIDSAGA